MLNKVLVHTNEQIEITPQKFKTHCATVSKTNTDALQGLYIFAAGLKYYHLPSKMMFESTFCGTRYRATTSQKRFNFLSSRLRFNNKQSRAERRDRNKFAPISAMETIPNHDHM